MLYDFKRANDFNVESILIEMKNRLQNRTDITDNVLCIEKMISYIFPRKEERIYSQINESNIVGHLIDCIPKGSIDEIKRKADLNDPDALLELADCKFFGLKNQRPDEMASLTLYKKAADLYQVEAIGFLAAGNYQFIATECNLFCLDAIPRNKAHLWEKQDLKIMWRLLEDLAAMNWITPFFIFQVKQAEYLSNWELSGLVKDAMNRRETGEKVDLIYISHIKPCQNEDCEIYINQPLRIVICKRCLKQKYCSERCQHLDWNKHKRECVLNPNADSPIADLEALRDALKSQIDELKETTVKDTDINRYYKIYISNLNQLQSRLTLLNTPESQHDALKNKNKDVLLNELLDQMDKDKKYDLVNKTTEKTLPNVLKFYELDSDTPTVHLLQNNAQTERDRTNRLLAITRLKNLPASFTVDVLSNKAHAAFQRKHYPNAIKFFVYTIDKILIEKPIHKMKMSEKVRLAKLYAKKIECNFELAKVHRSVKNADKIIDDCAYVLETGIFSQELLDTEIELTNNLKQFQRKALQLKNDLTGQNSRSTNRNQNKKKEKPKELIQDSYEVDARLCSELGNHEKKLAINASSERDQCPICQFGWLEHLEPKIAAILPCNHAFCADCLIDFYKEFLIMKENHRNTNPDDEELIFNCPLCRFNLTDNVFYDIANAFVKTRYFDNFAQKLPFSQDYMDNLAVSLLHKTHKFDLKKVEFCFTGMLELVDPRPNEDLNTEEKQQIYEEARKPIRQLQADYIEIRDSLKYLDTQTSEGKEKLRQFEDIKYKLHEATQNAYRDIYERVNSKNSVVMLNGEEILRIDLHSLHLAEAKKIIEDNVLPFLEFTKKIMVITGRGLHSENGQSILKSSIKEFFINLNFTCQDLEKNDGAFLVFGKF